MAKFNYVAMDSTGKETKGVLEMGSQTEALNRLKEMGLLPTKVTEAAAPKAEAKGAISEAERLRALAGAATPAGSCPAASAVAEVRRGLAK